MDLLLAIEDEEVTLDNPPVYEEQDPRVSREIRQKYREAAHELRGISYFTSQDFSFKKMV